MVSRGFHGMVDSRQLDCPKVSTMSPHTCKLCPRSKHKATKKRSKENAFNHATLSVHSVQFLFMGAPKARCSPERRMCETLLLANPDIDTLRHQCSRARTLAKEPPPPHAFELLRFLAG